MGKIIKILKENWFSKKLREIVTISLNADSFSSGAYPGIFGKTLLHLILCIFIYSLVALLLSLLHINELNAIKKDFAKIANTGAISKNLYYMNVYPYNILYLALLLFGYTLYAALVSHLTLIVFGEKNRSWKTTFALHWNGFCSLIGGVLIVTFLFNLYPGDYKEELPGLLVFTSFAMFFAISGIILYAVVFIRHAKLLYGQNVGRAFLTWGSPVIILWGFLYFVTH